MTTFKKFGVKVERDANGWRVNGNVYSGNKGQAVLQWLKENKQLKEGVWT